MVRMTVPNDAAGQFLASNQGAFPESRIIGLGITDPLLSTYRAAWNSQPPYWQAEMGVLFLSQPDNWILAQLTALPAPLAVKAIGYVGPNAPALPQIDTLWYDDQHETWKRWNGFAWVSQSGVSAGVASVNGSTGVVVVTAASLNALPTSSLGVSAASLDLTGVVPAAQSRVQSVAGRTGEIVLTAADVSGAISTASLNVSGGIPQLDATGHLSVAQMPAGYTGGGGGGGAVSSVAGRTGAITLAVADVTNAAAVDPTTNKLLISLVPARFSATVVQPGVAAVGRINPGGSPVPYATTLSYVIVTTSRPPLGSTASVLARARAHSTQSYTPLATIPIPVNTRRVVTSVNTPISMSDSLYADVQAVGSTEPGGDYTVQFIGVGAAAPPSALAAPASPTLLTTSAQVSGSITVGWTAPSGGGPTSTYHVYRTDGGGPLHWVGDVDFGTTTFIDTGLIAGVAYAYQVSASNDDAASVAVGATAYLYLNSAQFAADFVVYLGSNSGTNATVSGNTLAVTTGSVGGSTNGNAQDPVLVKWAGSTSLYSAMRWTFPISFGEANVDFMQVYLSANDFTSVTTTFTSGVQIQCSPLSFRVGIKAPSYNSGNFYVTTASTTSPVQSSPVGSSGGGIVWSIGTLPINTKFYITCELLVTNPSTGQALLNVYLATATGSPVLQCTVTLSSTQRAAIVPGRSFLLFLGLQATTGAANHFTLTTSGTDFVITPLSAPGT